MKRQQEILDFWFLPPAHPDYGKPREEWFSKNEEFDALVRDNFLEDFSKATEGHYLDWTDTDMGCLALILLLDQFSRNMFRDDPKAFSADAKAREIARHMIDRGYFDGLSALHKKFAALPFEHSENLHDQEYSMTLFKAFGGEVDIDYAQRHYDIIKKFGRFPHRNAVLNRQSTDEERAFLKTPGSSF
ncbi:DUF924 family protein [Sneathiella sp.]|jgi:uncharacterized protein (DUF924 family)|uniref:DUF924 family protein n=1 Tax=Sneathiella sp. TaxID=1964365 RepID=UPI0039E6869A